MTKEEVLKKLNTYFEYKTDSLLEILDTPSKTAAERGGYTGVTAGYLMKYVVPNINQALFIECIYELIESGVVATIYCGNIGKIVFEKYKSDYQHIRHPIDQMLALDINHSLLHSEDS